MHTASFGDSDVGPTAGKQRPNKYYLKPRWSELKSRSTWPYHNINTNSDKNNDAANSNHNNTNNDDNHSPCRNPDIGKWTQMETARALLLVSHGSWRPRSCSAPEVNPRPLWRLVRPIGGLSYSGQDVPRSPTEGGSFHDIDLNSLSLSLSLSRSLSLSLSALPLSRNIQPLRCETCMTLFKYALCSNSLEHNHQTKSEFHDIQASRSKPWTLTSNP